MADELKKVGQGIVNALDEIYWGLPEAGVKALEKAQILPEGFYESGFAPGSPQAKIGEVTGNIASLAVPDVLPVAEAKAAKAGSEFFKKLLANKVLSGAINNAIEGGVRAATGAYAKDLPAGPTTLAGAISGGVSGAVGGKVAEKLSKMSPSVRKLLSADINPEAAKASAMKLAKEQVANLSPELATEKLPELAKQNFQRMVRQAEAQPSHPSWDFPAQTYKGSEAFKRFIAPGAEKEIAASIRHSPEMAKYVKETAEELAQEPAAMASSKVKELIRTSGGKSPTYIGQGEVGPLAEISKYSAEPIIPKKLKEAIDAAEILKGNVTSAEYPSKYWKGMMNAITNEIGESVKTPPSLQQELNIMKALGASDPVLLNRIAEAQSNRGAPIEQVFANALTRMIDEQEDLEPVLRSMKEADVAKVMYQLFRSAEGKPKMMDQVLVLAEPIAKVFPKIGKIWVSGVAEPAMKEFDIGGAK